MCTTIVLELKLSGSPSNSIECYVYPMEFDVGDHWTFIAAGP